MSQVALPETRGRILLAAGKVFAAKGFKDATVREICAQAGVNLAAVNYHFGDKERLYVATIKSAHEHRATQVPMPEWAADTRPETKLRGFVLTMLDRMLNDPEAAWHQQLMLRELANPSIACQEWVRDYIRPHFDVLLAIISELVPAPVSLADRQLIVFSVIGQCLYHRVARPVVEMLLPADEFAALDVARLADHISRFTLAALGHRTDIGSTTATSPHVSHRTEVVE